MSFSLAFSDPMLELYVSQEYFIHSLIKVIIM